MKTWLGLSAALVLGARSAAAECVETASAGAERPQMVDTFPDRGKSGYVATLRAVISHGRGETVLPRGLELQSESDTARALRSAGFALPDQDAGAGEVCSQPRYTQRHDRAPRRWRLR